MRVRRMQLCFILLGLIMPSGLQAQTLPIGLSLPRALNFATSPTPVGSGARAQGQAVAFIAVADDATAASHNPGGLVQLERPEISIVGSSFIRVERQDVNLPDTLIANQTPDGFNLNYFSLAFPFRVRQRNVVVSLNYQRLFDFRGATDTVTGFRILDPDTGFVSGAGSHDVSSDQSGGLFSISPAVAVQISPTFSIGVALNIWPDLFDNGWEQDVTIRSSGLVFSGNNLVPFTSTGTIKEDFSFEGVNVTAGFLWTINSVFTLGGVFRSPFTADVTRTNETQLELTLQNGTAPVNAVCRFRDKLDMDMPMAYGLGLAARLTTELRLALDISRVHWSDFRLDDARQPSALEQAECAVLSVTTPVGKGPAILNGEGDDTTSVRLGAEYLWVRPKYVIPLRAGAFYDPEPGAMGTDHFFGFSLGSGIAVKSLIVDVAYTFRAGTVATVATDTTIHQHNILASVIYHF
ncbi:MAG: hypothetical protein ETSY2_12810 [Candidatus Entotheonella gemina]|uniref:Uncharacterized protein n=1 Tax=Candidatus Entotheonella gemina TaxID=1429439 RepID=W4M9V4_9BACT|nr:MAG: hypothetical protein ETSY2_12810 [Candidatus Entotheonella gemina]